MDRTVVDLNAAAVAAPGVVTGVSKGMVWVQDVEGRIIKVKKSNVRPAGLGLAGLA